MNRKPIGLVLAFLMMVLSLGGTGHAQAKKEAPAAQKKTEQAQKKSDLIDLNSATKAELMTLPGVGDATAQKIIDNRPYRAKNQLVQKKIVSQSVYDKISGQIIAKQATAGSKKKGK